MSHLKATAPYVGMVVVQLAYASSNILCKLALDQGLSFLVLAVYRHLIALAVFGPLAFVLERNQRPSLSFYVLVRIFILALFGTTLHQNVYYAGLNYTSPTVASALGSVIPAFTFIMAAILRMEKVSIKSAKGRARLVGTILCIGGVLVFTFWKGHLLEGFVRTPLIEVHGSDPKKGAVNDQENWIKGTALILTSLFAYSAWLILQGIVISCLTYYLQTYCVSEKGPVFVATFSPVLLVIVGIASAFVFAERLHIGSLIGATIIIVGLYCVLWGKSSDTNEKNSGVEKSSRDACH
ncbi:hypothetical protein ZIOFF_034903 [Zingiber officinale]|uniref:WAT1-related protein n=1 Tax=Zingiber officinale TaxID=94328 RepID=A0A8J5GJ82_ZINOF|nr:hypothetical protein ZIOFF_034903 [Zingiber officinale]